MLKCRDDEARWARVVLPGQLPVDCGCDGGGSSSTSSSSYGVVMMVVVTDGWWCKVVF